MKGRTITLRKKDYPYRNLHEILDRRCTGSAGPNPSIYGMRKKFWGDDALVVRYGRYAYYFGKDIGCPMKDVLGLKG